MLKLRDIKKVFDFLVNKYKMKIIRCDYYKKAFGDIVIDYQNKNITLRVIRDRLQIFIEVKIDDKFYSYSFLRAIIRKIDLEKFDNEKDIKWYLDEKDINKIADDLEKNMLKLIDITNGEEKISTLQKMEILLKTLNKNRGWDKIGVKVE